MKDKQIAVLLIEDNPGDARFIQEMLAEARDVSFCVTVVDRLQTGLERVAAGGIDAVLLDLSLPDSQGLDTFITVHRRVPHVPIIVLTGLADAALAVQAVRQGAQDYLVKGEVGGGLLVRSIRHAIERKRAEEALQATKHYAQNLIDSSLDMIVSVDGNRNIVEFNWAAEETLGYSKAEVLGKPIDFLYADPSEGARVYAALSNYQAYTGSIRNKRKNGEIFYSFLSASVMRDANGRVVGRMGVSRDITERKRAEEALEESNRRLEETLALLKATQQQVLQQERLRALGEMAGGIAHDFNNALSPILGYSELLLDRPDHLANKQKLTRYLQMINTSAKDAASVVRRLREFYRVREEDEIFLPVNLNHLVGQVIMLTQPKWKDQPLASGITINLELQLEDVPLISGNEAELREILTNLVFNAVDAMSEGGTLTVRTRHDEGYVVLEVGDSGTGMTEEVRQRCLEPFFTTKRELGTGLGLAMVYGIVQRHRGTLTIESELDRGATFIIHLPVHMEQEAEKKSLEVAAVPARQLRILAVDDEPPVLEVVTAYLTADGHTVETANNGVEALQKFLGDSFDVLVTDQGMPEMAGGQLAAAIKQVAPDKPVILLTGFGDLISASGLKPAGVDIIVSKPVSLAALRQALAKVAAQ